MDIEKAFEDFVEDNRDQLPSNVDNPDIRIMYKFWFERGYQNAAFGVQVGNVLSKSMEYVCEAPLGSPERLERFSHARQILKRMNIELHPDAIKEVLEEGVLDN